MPGRPMRAIDVLARGYLPYELPPCFTSAPFAAASSTLSVSRPRERTAPVALNLARPGSIRRRLTIPNPFAQLSLAEEIEGGWATIETHLRHSKISLSRPVIGKTDERALMRRYSFDGRLSERAQRMNLSRFTLVSDVSECYGSIYTHSLEWALHTRTAARLASQTAIGVSRHLARAWILRSKQVRMDRPKACQSAQTRHFSLLRLFSVTSITRSRRSIQGSRRDVSAIWTTSNLCFYASRG